MMQGHLPLYMGCCITEVDSISHNSGSDHLPVPVSTCFFEDTSRCGWCLFQRRLFADFWMLENGNQREVEANTWVHMLGQTRSKYICMEVRAFVQEELGAPKGGLFFEAKRVGGHSYLSFSPMIRILPSSNLMTGLRWIRKKTLYDSGKQAFCVEPAKGWSVRVGRGRIQAGGGFPL